MQPSLRFKSEGPHCVVRRVGDLPLCAKPKRMSPILPKAVRLGRHRVYFWVSYASFSHDNEIPNNGGTHIIRLKRRNHCDQNQVKENHRWFRGPSRKNQGASKPSPFSEKGSRRRAKPSRVELFCTLPKRGNSTPIVFRRRSAKSGDPTPPGNPRIAVESRNPKDRRNLLAEITRGWWQSEPEENSNNRCGLISTAKAAPRLWGPQWKPKMEQEPQVTLWVCGLRSHTFYWVGRRRQLYLRVLS